LPQTVTRARGAPRPCFAKNKSLVRTFCGDKKLAVVYIVLSLSRSAAPRQTPFSKPRLLTTHQRSAVRSLHGVRTDAARRAEGATRGASRQARRTRSADAPRKGV